MDYGKVFLASYTNLLKGIDLSKLNPTPPIRKRRGAKGQAVKKRCLLALSKPFGQHSVADLCFQIVYRSDGKVTYRHDGEEFTEPSAKATEANAIADKMLRYYPPLG